MPPPGVFTCCARAHSYHDIWPSMLHSLILRRHAHRLLHGYLLTYPLLRNETSSPASGAPHFSAHAFPFGAVAPFSPRVRLYAPSAKLPLASTPSNAKRPSFPGRSAFLFQDTHQSSSLVPSSFSLQQALIPMASKLSSAWKPRVPWSGPK